MLALGAHQFPSTVRGTVINEYEFPVQTGLVKDLAHPLTKVSYYRLFLVEWRADRHLHPEPSGAYGAIQPRRHGYRDESDHMDLAGQFVQRNEFLRLRRTRRHGARHVLDSRYPQHAVLAADRLVPEHAIRLPGGV